MATIESAAPLPADLQTVVQNQLRHRYGPGLTIVFAHHPELIGGMRIQVGCDVYDGSVRAGLEALEKSFLNEGIYG
jgi:F-type H+-transporting ATPase subunit delta